MQEGKKSKRFLGITVFADFIISEGIENVLKNVADVAGATADRYRFFLLEPIYKCRK